MCWRCNHGSHRAFYLFILLTSNPFLRLADAPMEGRDLNPILQDLGLAIHPPLLYLGYVGFSIAFSFAIAALIEGRIDAAWARWVRPWTLAAWMFLTLGIAMGSYWAYYTLGWGGFWFWDPVENASLMPWLAGTALLHSAVVMEKRNALKVWTILLAILTFSLSLVGTFLVRSGVLTSVHSFANDPRRGVFILAILVLFIGGSLALFAWRASTLKQGGLFAPISREGALVFNNLFLTTACLTVFVGTLYPLALEAATGAKISVGAPFFNLTFGPLFVALMFAMPFGPLLAWKRGDILGVAQRLMSAFGIGIVAVAIAFAIEGEHSILAPFGVGLAFYVMAGAVVDLVERTGLFRAPLATVRMRAAGLPRSTWGTAMAHFGIAVSMLGIISAATWGTELIVALKPNQTVSLSGYDLTFDGMVSKPGPNYSAQIARFIVRSGGTPIGVLEPSRRTFASRQTTTNEAALMMRGAGQLYLSLGDANDDGSVAVRLYYKPLVMLIWFGAVIMMLGGAMSLSDRRLRIGAPKPAAKTYIAGGGVAAMRCFALLTLLLALLAPGAAFAVQPDEILKDPALEARARQLSEELRCMVCQNQSIDNSNAPLAHDLRVLVRQRLTEGDSDKQVMDFLVARYGEFVLLKPRLELHTLLLWGLPPAALLAGGIALVVMARRRKNVNVQPEALSAAEQRRLSTLVESQPD